MAKRHVMTAKRRAALRKAQLVSARKRRKSRSSDLRKAASSRRLQSSRGSGQHRKAAYRKYDAQVAAIYQKHGSSASSAKRIARARKYTRRAVKTYGTATILFGPHLTNQSIVGAAKAAKAGHAYGKGFAKGYSGSKQRRKMAAHNISRMGGTTVHRIGVPALPAGGSGSRQTRSQRRRYR